MSGRLFLAPIHFMLAVPSTDDRRDQKPFLVQYHVRGRRKCRPLTTHCETLQDIIDVGRRSFHEFENRNPWICFDSKRGTVFVGLDAERSLNLLAASKDIPPEVQSTIAD